MNFLRSSKGSLAHSWHSQSLARTALIVGKYRERERERGRGRGTGRGKGRGGEGEGEGEEREKEI